MRTEISHETYQDYINYSSSVITPKQKESISIFSNPQFGEIRTAIGENGEPMFCAKDVATALGYIDTSDAISRHCKSGKKVFHPHNNGMGGVYMVYITEKDVYRLIMRSNLPDAEKFQDWVCDDVLPSLRKYGVYSISKYNIGELTKARAFAAQFVKDELRLNDASYLGLLQQVTAPLGLELPQYVPSKGVLKSASVLLKEIGSPMSALKFNQLLETHGYVETISRPTANGKARTFKNITGKGKPYGENEVNPKNQKETQPHWYVERFSELYGIVTA